MLWCTFRCRRSGERPGRCISDKLHGPCFGARLQAGTHAEAFPGCLGTTRWPGARSIGSNGNCSNFRGCLKENAPSPRWPGRGAPGPPPVRGGRGPTPARPGARGVRSLPSSLHGEHIRAHFPVSQAEPHGLFRHVASWEALVSVIHMSLVTVLRHPHALSVQSKSHFLASFLRGCSLLSFLSPGREGLLLGSC